jgi:hypothetical protein
VVFLFFITKLKVNYLPNFYPLVIKVELIIYLNINKVFIIHYENYIYNIYF